MLTRSSIYVQRPKGTSWKDLRSFAFEDVKNPTMESTTKWCQPFPFDVSNFPMQSAQSSRHTTTTLDPASNAKDPYIPSHLPAFPPAHTYKKTSGSKKRSSKAQAASADEPEEDEAGPARKAKRSTTIKSAQKSLSAIEDCIDAGLGNS